MAEGAVYFKFLNGSNLRSKVSGFSGRVTARANYLYGCNRYFLSPPVNKDGGLPDGYWFDEPELELIDSSLVEGDDSENGGPPNRIK